MVKSAFGFLGAFSLVLFSASARAQSFEPSYVSRITLDVANHDNPNPQTGEIEYFSVAATYGYDAYGSSFASEPIVFSGVDSGGNPQDMVFSGNGYARADDAGLHLTNQARLMNSISSQANAFYYDYASGGPNSAGVPDLFRVVASTRYTDLLSFLGTASGAGYTASYSIRVDGFQVNPYYTTTLAVAVGGNAPETFIMPEGDGGNVDLTFETGSYAVSDDLTQLLDVTFATQCDFDVWSIPETNSFNLFSIYGDTAAITAVRLFDPAGTPVGSYSIDSATGFAYPTAPVPEPSSLAFLGFGALGILRRRAASRKPL